MADNKRNSVATKIATPKTSGAPATQNAPVQPAVDTLEALSKSIGARIKLTTAAPQSQSYEGTLFTACPILNVVAINTRTTAADVAAQAGDYHIIPVSSIQSFQVISLAPNVEGSKPGLANAQPAIGPVDIKRLKNREQARIAKLKEEDSDRGRGVTKEGQALYDELKRVNTPIRWHEQDMIVFEAVIVKPPYRAENCQGSKDKQGTVDRVQKALEGARNNLKKREREEQQRNKATPVGPRKGG